MYFYNFLRKTSTFTAKQRNTLFVVADEVLISLSNSYLGISTCDEFFKYSDHMELCVPWNDCFFPSSVSDTREQNRYSLTYQRWIVNILS